MGYLQNVSFPGLRKTCYTRQCLFQLITGLSQRICLFAVQNYLEPFDDTPIKSFLYSGYLEVNFRSNTSFSYDADFLKKMRNCI